jgi:biotin operon repressor
VEVSLDSLIREIQAASPSTLEQLEVASQRAADLADVGDSLLSHFVDRCRKEGNTWAEIGEHLGVTRQAVQKRFVEGPFTFERFTDRARLAIAHANDEARGMNHNYIGTEHLLLALVDTNGGVSDVVLQELGITRAAISKEIETRIGRGPTPVTGQQPFTPRAKKVLDEAINTAVELGHNYIGTEHLLMALFRGQDGLAKQVLEQHNASEAAVRTAVIEKLAGFQSSGTNAPAKTATKSTRRSAKAKSATKSTPSKARTATKSRRRTI